MKKLFLTLMVCAGLAACTSDDVVIGTTSDSAFNGGDLYMQVFISDVKDGGTRATGTTEEGNNNYSNGSESEYDVNDAEFYFYDQDGVFISRASVWDENGSENETNPSIEYTSGTMIVLKGLTSTQLPKYMVTILNEPDGVEDSNYDPANTLGELESKTVDGCMYGNGYFIMSTSSYTDTATDDTGVRSAENKHYFVTEIDEDNFCEEPITSSSLDNAVQVYVERLAAKVEVDVANSLTGTTTTDGDTYYELDITVGGRANEDVASEEIEGEENESQTVYEGIDKVYVKFLGWKLNATARQSYIMKNVDDAWDSTSSWANSTWNVKAEEWNDATNKRSYWGKGTAYGTGNFPTTNIKDGNTVSNTDEDETSASTWLNDYLQYTSLKEGTLDIGPATTDASGATTGDYYGYCAENTNVVATDEDATNGIKDEYSSGITSVLLKAQAYSYDATTGYSPLALVNYAGLYWTVDGFKDEIARTEVYYDIKHVSALATEAGLSSTIGSVLQDIVGYMEPELYCATNEINSQSWDATSDKIKTFDGSFLGLVDLQNGGVGIWPKDSGTNHSDDSSAEITSKYKPVYTTGTTTEAYPAADDLDKYYLYLKITDKDAWDAEMKSLTEVLLDATTVTDADGNYYFYLDETNTLGNYTYRQFFVKALETQAEETNDYFAGIIDADGSSVTTTSTTTAPNLYLDGLMYYSIPIEHLVSATEESEATIVEGQYGVVRNHWYTISITGLSKLGRGISNEDAVIVPDPEGIDTWLLPAQVNINAWLKVTDQQVSL